MTGRFSDVLVTSLARRAEALPSWRSADVDVVRGSLVLCEVVQLGCYRAVEVFPGQDIPLAAGRRLIAVAGTRRSSSSFSGEAPIGSLLQGAPLDLLAVGGVVGTCDAVPAGSGPPTRVRYVATVCDDAGVVTLRDSLGGGPIDGGPGEVPVVAVAGTAAEVGKTRLAGGVVGMLARAGLRVGACKLKGTGRMRDLNAVRAAGAASAFDFVDAGLESTYDVPDDIVRRAARRVLGAAAHGNDIVVAELGGDLLSGGGPAILEDAAFRRAVRVLFLVGSDVFAISGALQFLAALGWPSPIFLGPTRRNNAVCDALVRRLTEQGLVLDDAGLRAALAGSGLLAAPVVTRSAS